MFTRFYLPQAVAAGYRLADDAAWLWKAFERLHQQHGLAGTLEIPMESFARAVEIVLKESELRDAAGLSAGRGAVGSGGAQLRLHPVAHGGGRTAAIALAMSGDRCCRS